jgi:transcription elongation regulator 1
VRCFKCVRLYDIEFVFRQDQTAEKKDEPAVVNKTASATASVTVTSTTAEPKTIEAGKEAAMEAEVKAARERAIIPLEIRMKQFRDMLSEKDVIILLFF